ncbi:MAG TPA: SigE family RNA polymerase sigma factor [Acidimicrobiales bacterium]|jgi:RNA polymerase sigma-70 factor (sigma-E family)|nr:SigE family RNA polymerase sigma factor [Acidimicrobiales bacterium]
MAAPELVTDDEVAPVTARSFDEVFADEYDRMVRLAFLLVDSNALAEEIVQDAFVRLHQRWETTANPGGYVRTSVVNGARSTLRRRRLERAVRNRGDDPRDQAVELQADELSDALRRLAPTRRAALVLRYYDDLSEAEIAATLGVKPGTVKSMVHRALAELREVIER